TYLMPIATTYSFIDFLTLCYSKGPFLIIMKFKRVFTTSECTSCSYNQSLMPSQVTCQLPSSGNPGQFLSSDPSQPLTIIAIAVSRPPLPGKYAVNPGL